MKKFVTVFLLVVIFLSCEKDNGTKLENSYFWSPVIHIEKGNNEATLTLVDPRPFTDYYPYPPSNPEYFEIYYSNNINTLTFYKKVDASTTSVTVPNLINGEPYYFMVTSNKGDFDPKHTDTIMTIPSAIVEPEEIFPNNNFSTQRLLFSHDNAYITFKSNDFSNQYYGEEMLYYTDISIDSTWAIEKNTYGTSWSNSKNIIAYINTTTINNTTYPYKLKLFDVEFNETTTLFEVDFDEFYVSTPVFSPDDKLLGFLSSENNSEIYNYNIWTIDLSTKVKTKISEFEPLNFSTNGYIDWPTDGGHIYLDGHYQPYSDDNIYKLNISTGELFPVIISPWKDRVPSVSPDHSKIAFISDRTGKDELWAYDFETTKYVQVTGGASSYHFDSRYSNIQWLNNNEIVLTVFKGSTSRVVKISVE